VSRVPLAGLVHCPRTTFSRSCRQSTWRQVSLWFCSASWPGFPRIRTLVLSVTKAQGGQADGSLPLESSSVQPFGLAYMLCRPPLAAAAAARQGRDTVSGGVFMVDILTTRERQQKWWQNRVFESGLYHEECTLTKQDEDCDRRVPLDKMARLVSFRAMAVWKHPAYLVDMLLLFSVSCHNQRW
jgi:hypothetical protein